MRLRFKKDKQKGIISAFFALISSFGSIIVMLLIVALIFWIHHLMAGLIGGGNQPGGNCNIGCHLEGPDISKATSTKTQMFSLTAYYHPLPDQTKYETGSYKSELLQEGGGSGASGIKLGKGAISAPPSYPFGTEIDIPVFGRGIVIDRGCAIQEAGVPSKCSGYGATKYDHLDLYMGEGDQGRMAMDQWNGKEAQGTIYYFNFVNKDNVSDYVKVVCQPPAGCGGNSKVACLPHDTAGNCGVASVAMLVNFYTGKTIDPDTLDYNDGLIALLDRYAPQQKWCTADNYLTDKTKVTQILSNGQPIMFFTACIAPSGKTSSSLHHIMVMTGYDGTTDSVYINNSLPNSCTNQKWSWQTIASCPGYGGSSREYVYECSGNR